MTDFFRRVRLLYRLWLMPILAIAAMTLVALIYQSTLATQNAAQARLLAAQDLRAQASALDIALLQLRRAEKDFIVRKDPKYLSRHADWARNAIDLVDKLQSNRDPIAADKAIIVGRHLPDYEDAFSRVAEGDFSAETLAPLSQIYSLMAPSVSDLVSHAEQLATTALDDGQASSEQGQQQAILLVLLTALVITALSLGVTRSITKPLSWLESDLQRLRDGAFDAPVMGKDYRDSIGFMARATDELRLSALETERLRQEQAAARELEAQREIDAQKAKQQRQKEKRIAEAEAAKTASEERASMRASLADDFNRSVETALVGLAATNTRLDDAIAILGNSSSQASKGTQQVVDGTLSAQDSITRAEQASSAVADGLNRIEQAVSRARDVNKSAHTTAQQAGERVQTLSDAANTITAVVTLIRDIAEQTNLLALNATIEAARAGDAGRGFAVVASEVKSLAAQTAGATADIEHQISAIGNSTDQTVDAVSALSQALYDVQSIMDDVIGAVDEQATRVDTIVTAAADARSNAATASQQADQVASMTAEASDATKAVAKSAQDLAQERETMRTAVSDFLVKLTG